MKTEKITLNSFSTLHRVFIPKKFFSGHLKKFKAWKIAKYTLGKGRIALKKISIGSVRKNAVCEFD